MNAMSSPKVIYGELFDAVQNGEILSDSKIFIDALPKRNPDEIVQDFLRSRDGSSFDLNEFVEANFDLPPADKLSEKGSNNLSVRDYIERMWDELSRSTKEAQQDSSLLTLPYPYIVPGGRFREIYYWDSYFTMLGLVESGRIDLVEHMVNNFAFLIDQVGFIPNGNRTYYCSRSQPPFFALMVELLAEAKGERKKICSHYLPQLRREYDFWMDGSDQLSENGQATKRVIRVDDGYLNRFWDSASEPRPEGYIEDKTVASAADRDLEELYRDIRAGAESGWDFCSRWFADGTTIETIRTTQVAPVDLNCLLYRLESLLAEAYQYTEQQFEHTDFEQRADKRKQLLTNRFFNSEAGFFCDLLLPDLTQSPTLSLAAASPLYFGIATDDQARQVSKKIESEFLRKGGWVNTLENTGQQWDAPNGWPPSQWFVFCGLKRYGYLHEARLGAKRWIDNNLLVYKKTGMLMEKYNVEKPGEIASGGEYQVQEGFGWTNGVLLSLMAAFFEK